MTGVFRRDADPLLSALLVTANALVARAVALRGTTVTRTGTWTENVSVTAGKGAGGAGPQKGGGPRRLNEGGMIGRGRPLLLKILKRTSMTERRPRPTTIDYCLALRF